MKGDRSATKAIAHHLEGTAIEATAVLGETTLTLRELLDLEPGDVLRTSIPVDGEVKVLIGAKPMMLGRPGISNGRVAVKVTRKSQEPATGE